jgi:hypothetical protein
MANVHIYALSRLVHAGPRAWQRMLKEIEDGVSYASQYYLPMREGVVALASKNGGDVDIILQGIKTKVRDAGGARMANRLKDNLFAFENFKTEFLPRLRRLNRSFLHDKKQSCEFGGLDLYGSPHFEATDGDGRTRHVFLHAAKWNPKDLSAYLELLGLIVERNYGGDATSIWVMDLRSGKDHRWKPRPSMRRRCEDTARLYSRFLGVMGESQVPEV